MTLANLKEDISNFEVEEGVTDWEIISTSFIDYFGAGSLITFSAVDRKPIYVEEPSGDLAEYGYHVAVYLLCGDLPYVIDFSQKEKLIQLNRYLENLSALNNGKEIFMQVEDKTVTQIHINNVNKFECILDVFNED